METKINNGFVMTDPGFAQKLFSSTRWAWLWLIVRVYLGYSWVTSGIGKFGNPAWVSGEALKGYWTRAVAIPATPAKPVITYDFYRSFLQSMLDAGAYTWFAKLVMFAEVLIGIALIIGLFTGIAAFFGGFMNWNFMMAGTASTNPVLFTIAILLILAWKIAGWWGLDRFVLPILGTPWRPGKVFGKAAPAAELAAK